MLATSKKSRVRFSPISGWMLLAVAIIAAVIVPLIVVFSAFFYDASDVWQHISATLLSEVAVNTLSLAIGVCLLSFVLGVGLAWLTCFFDFPARQYLEWMLLLPLAIPTYVMGFVWIGLLDYSGTIPSFVRDFYPASVWYFPIRSRLGITLVMSLAFYPYVYLLTRNAFLTQSRSMVEAARTFGMKAYEVFFRLTLPMARPWIFAGVLLVFMETLADFGTVSIFNYRTFTTAIYKAWFNMFSIEAAAQLSAILVGTVLLALVVEFLMRGRRAYTQGSIPKIKKERYVLKGSYAVLGFLLPSIVLTVSFVIPVIQLAYWAIKVMAQDLDSRYVELLFQTIFLAAFASVLTAVAALILSYTSKRHAHPVMQWLMKIGTLGYAFPGTVLAVGIFSSLVWVDAAISHAILNFFNINMGRILTGSIFAMLLAYVVRFLRVSFSTIDSSMERITTHISEAAQNLGCQGFDLLKNIYVPLIRGGFLTALLFVFVEIMKEMPITLMTRPFGWNTLAVKIFELTSEGEWERAALPAIFLVMIGFIPVYLLTRQRAWRHAS